MSKQLWQKGSALNARIHRFTVGNDPQTDLKLVPYDVLGTLAHVHMLEKVGLLLSQDAQSLVAELTRLQKLIEQGSFCITPEQEDCHTAIEQALTAALGDAGKNVHFGRSRNDQVILALRLYMRQSVVSAAALVSTLASAFLDFAEANADVAMPGYTHLRRAMPSSGGLWAVGYAEALVEELEALQAVYVRLDRCPLGSGAGFGVPLPIDREYVAELLGFSRVQRSVTDVQNSRGRHELALTSWISSVARVVEQFLCDAALYTTEEFGLLVLPDEFTTGSSIMPQKSNPDVIELSRGRCAQIRAWRNEIEQVASGLPGSYHRDYQLLKEPLIRCIEGFNDLLEILALLVPRLSLDSERCAAACSIELYATQEAYRRVLVENMPFRDAYVAVGVEVIEGRFNSAPNAPVPHHVGSRGNLGVSQVRGELDSLTTSFKGLEATFLSRQLALRAESYDSKCDVPQN